MAGQRGGGVHLHYQTNAATQLPYVLLISDITIKLVVEHSYISKLFKGYWDTALWCKYPKYQHTGVFDV